MKRVLIALIAAAVTMPAFAGSMRENVVAPLVRPCYTCQIKREAKALKVIERAEKAEAKAYEAQAKAEDKAYNDLLKRRDKEAKALEKAKKPAKALSAKQAKRAEEAACAASDSFICW